MKDFERQHKLSNYTSYKRFICLKWILQNYSTILYSQFNYHSLPVTPLNILKKTEFSGSELGAITRILKKSAIGLSR